MTATWPIRGIQRPPQTDGVPGVRVSHASGNPDVATQDAVAPPKTPYGQPRKLGVGQETSWRGGDDFSNDKLITSDRHAFLDAGTERGGGRLSGTPDAPMDGPARPSLRLVNRTINYQQGTDNDSAQDDLSRHFTRNAQGMYVGEQGHGWSEIYGGVPGLWQPYGSYAGITNGPVQGIQSPVPQGVDGDGPHSVFSGPPHGLHSLTMSDYSPTIGRYMAIPQMHAPRMDRPSNSKIAGQSYSQTVVPQGQAGTVAQNTRYSSGVNWKRVQRPS